MSRQTPPVREPAGSTPRSNSGRVFSAFLNLAVIAFGALARGLKITGVVFYTRVRVTRLRERTSLQVVLAAVMMFAVLATGMWLKPSSATAATAANTINFQARLQASTGAVAPDGTYNIEFKLYSASSGGSALWTEDYLVSASNGLQTKNGYFSTGLGSVTPFPSSINWGQQLFLTMNVGGVESTVDWDGEMNPRLSLTSVPSAFALNSYNPDTGYTGSLKVAQATGGNQTFTVPDQGAAGSYTLLTSQAAAAGFIQNTTSSQSGANFNVGGTGTVGGALTVGGAATLNGALSVTAGASVASTTGTALTVTGASGQSVAVFNTVNDSSLQITDTGGLLMSGSDLSLDVVSGDGDIKIGTESGDASTYIGDSSGTGGVYVNPGAQGLTVSGSPDDALVKIQNTGSGADIQLSSGILRNAADSTSALTIQNSDGSETLFSADTTNNRLVVGNSTGSGDNTTSFVLDNGTTDPTGVPGAMYYNTGSETFRCYSAGAWRDCADGSEWSTTGSNAAGSVLGVNSSSSADFVISSRPNDVGATSSGASYISFSGDEDTNPNRITISGNANANVAQGSGDWLSTNTSDYFRIQDSSGNVAFAVQGSGSTQQVFAYLSAGAAVGVQSRVCSTLEAGASGMATLATCTNTGTDLAEAYNSTQSLEAGDIVATDSDNYPNVLRSTTPGQDNLLGIVSTDPDQTMGTGKTPNGYPIALNGRVPTKVNGEGGVIHPGDKITSSSVAGVGKKATEAGMIVGTALTGFDGNGQGTIEVFVHLSYYEPSAVDTLQAQTGLLGDLNVSGQATITNLTVTGLASVQDLQINGHLITAGVAPQTQILGDAGKDASVIINGNDVSGTIMLTTGTSGTIEENNVLAAGGVVAITFNKPFTAVPRVMVTGDDGVSVQVEAYPMQRTANGFILSFNQLPTANTTYTFTYFVAQ